MNKVVLPYDSVGIIASTLCMIHCIGTPFIFIAKACTSICCANAPTWWVMIDYIFLFISFLAIFFISKNLTVEWLKISFWLSWIVLLFTILNHSFDILYLPQNFIYIPSFLIIVLHFYNLKFCKCEKETCCANTILEK